MNEISWFSSSVFLFIIMLISYYHTHFFNISKFMTMNNKSLLFDFNLLF